MIASTRPDATESAEYHFTYINQVGEGDIRQILEAQQGELGTLLGSISGERAEHRYAPDKWTIRQVMSHVNDTERVFAFRALWFARGFAEPLASFDQNVAMASADAEARPWRSHVEEFDAVRAATVALFNGLTDAAWLRRGTASGHSFTVRAMAYIIAGHVTHHARILRERYL